HGNLAGETCDRVHTHITPCPIRRLAKLVALDGLLMHTFTTNRGPAPDHIRCSGRRGLSSIRQSIMPPELGLKLRIESASLCIRCWNPFRRSPRLYRT